MISTRYAQMSSPSCVVLESQVTIAHTFLLKASLVLCDVLNGVVLWWCNELVESNVGVPGEVTAAIDGQHVR